MESLEQRMRSFLASRDDARDLDADPRLSELERADFVVGDGAVICEIKSIRQDTTRKIPEVLRRYGIKVEPGRHNLSHILAGRTDAIEIERAVWHAICSALESDIRNANSQIRAEKIRAGENATGLLVLLNDSVADLHPALLLKGIGQKLGKARDGVPRFPNLNLVWVVSEVFPTEAGPVQAFLGHAPNPLVPISAPGLALIRELNDQWQREPHGTA